MARPSDYRSLPFDIRCMADCGKYLGDISYWKLYSTENLVRSIVHSVLSTQIGPSWLSVVIGQKKNRLIQHQKQDYAAQSHRSSPGRHDIYYLYLSDLSKIMATNSHLFTPIIPDISDWILKLEAVRLPRNIIGHMNWLNLPDEADIRRVYLDFKGLARRLFTQGFLLRIP